MPAEQDKEEEEEEEEGSKGSEEEEEEEISMELWSADTLMVKSQRDRCLKRSSIPVKSALP